MRFRLSSALLFAALVPLPIATAQTTLYTVSNLDGFLRQIDPATGATLATVTIQIPGQIVTQGQAIATDPTNGTVYAVLTVNGQMARRLATIDPATGNGVDVGDLLDKFSGLAFDSSGQLFGVTGDGATVPEALYAVDKSTAAKTLLAPLGHGSNGESLGFQPFDGLLYHASGIGVLNDPAIGLILETVDPFSLAVTAIPLSGGPITGIQGLARLDPFTFLAVDQGGRLFTLATTGALSQIGQLDHIPKGIAFVTGPSTFQSFGTGCAGTAGFTPSLTGAGSPNPGSTVSLTVTNGLGAAPGVLLFGLGAGSISVVPSCSVQIAPVFPIPVPLILGGAGPGGGTLALSGTIPPDVVMFQISLQVLFADGGAPGGVSATNPLRMQIQ